LKENSKARAAGSLWYAGAGSSQNRIGAVTSGLETIGSATNFQSYVENTYTATVLPLLAHTTQDCYRVVIDKYLMPSFGSCCLRDLSPLTLQRYFTSLPRAGVSYPSSAKIRDALSSILRSAVRYGLLDKNPLDDVELSICPSQRIYV
jgi:hypothetical protein